MSPAANILTIHALDELRAAMQRFGSESQQSLNEAAREIQRTLDWLAERLRYWQNEVRRCQELVARARAALARCQAGGYYDPETGRRYIPDCSADEAALAQAQARQHAAESELRNVQEWLRQVQQAGTDYQREAQRLAALVNADLPKATALLDSSATILQSYVAMNAPAVSDIASSISSPAIASDPTTTTAALSSPQHDRFRSVMLGMSRLERGAWGEDAVAREIHRLGHRMLFEHQGAATTPGYDSVSWDGLTLHIWEAKNYSSDELGTANVVQDLSALNAERSRQNVVQFLNRLPENDPDRDAIARAIQSDHVQWHIRLGPDTDISFTPLDKLGWGSVEAHQYTYADMLLALLHSPPSESGSTALPEAREGS